MTDDRFKRLRQTTFIHQAMETREMLRRLREFPNPPASMEFFYDLYQSRTEPGKHLFQGDRLIGTMCVQVPDEIIYALDARPVRLCSGVQAYEAAGADLMPARSCPVVKATLGMFESTTLSDSDNLLGIVVPATCDQKRKAAEMLSAKGIPVHLLEVPPSKESETARNYWQESVKECAVTLERWTQKTLTKKKLARSILAGAKAGRLYRRLTELQRHSPTPLHGKDMLLVGSSYFFTDRDRWIDAVSKLCDELEKRVEQNIGAASPKAVRILLTGSPAIFPNLKVPLLVEETGAVIVADELCSSNRLLNDQPIIGEGALYDMLPALADRYLKPCTCPCLAGNQDRERRLLSLARDYRVDGVIYQSFSGCLPYEMEQRRISAFLTEHQIPMLYLETDYSPEDMGQISTRVEAFLESIKVRKRKQAAAA